MFNEKKYQTSFYQRYLEIPTGTQSVDEGSLEDYILQANKDMFNRKSTLFYTPISNLLNLDWDSNTGSIYWIRVLTVMDQFFDYMAGEFDFSDNYFQGIKKIFTKHYYLGSVYVGYGKEYVDNEEKHITIESSNNVDRFTLDAVDYPWRLYTYNKSNETYRSLVSKIDNISFEGTGLKPVKVSAFEDGVGMSRFLELFDLAKEVVTSYYFNLQLVNIVTKRIHVFHKDEQTRKKLIEEIKDSYRTYIENDTSKIEALMPMELAPAEFPSTVSKAISSKINERWTMLGMIKTMEDKPERLTSGEHIKQVKPPINIMNRIKGMLEEFCYKASRKFNVNIYLLPNNFITTLAGGEQMHWSTNKGNNMYDTGIGQSGN